MITLPIVTNWNICTPVLYRYLDSKYVDAFFKDGSLRLSSFAQFKKHSDEQRLDQFEGKTTFVHSTQQNGGQTIESYSTQGTDSYVLSTSMRFDPKIMNDFKTNSYIRINDPTSFGMAVSRRIPSFVAGFEGPCLYQSNKIIQKDLGYIDLDKFKRQDGQINIELVKNFIFSNMKHFGCFLKDKIYETQSEYRFIWFILNDTADYLDIQVPEAIPYCEKPNQLTE
jgi:hypothetical protein